MLEIDAAPDRRDLSDIHARAAAEAGVDDRDRLRRAQPADAGLIRYGVATARRGVADRRAGGEHAAVAASWRSSAAERRRAEPGRDRLQAGRRSCSADVSQARACATSSIASKGEPGTT